MLQVLEGRVSKRKLRLFACACCRRIWNVIPDARYRAAVETSERFADGLCDRSELQLARLEALKVHPGGDSNSTPGEFAAASVARYRIIPRWIGWLTRRASQQLRRTEEEEGAYQATMLREIFGNPFLPLVPDPLWSHWNDGAIVRLAQNLYEENRHDELPILADALEEAGCVQTELLDHLRKPGRHLKGCWALDLVLGRE
ncbi:MAG: hypothetical protein U0840_19135 [Gemmataceae bacterium]